MQEEDCERGGERAAEVASTPAHSRSSCKGSMEEEQRRAGKSCVSALPAFQAVPAWSSSKGSVHRAAKNFSNFVFIWLSCAS